MSWPPLALAQVEAVHPEEGAVSVVFPNLSMITGLRIKVPGQGASGHFGAFEMPRAGDWGIVMFYQDHARSGIWAMNLTDLYRHAIPLELLAKDALLRTLFERTGRDTYRHGNGDIEVQHPDGSLFRLTHGSGDPAKRSERKVGTTSGQHRTPERIDPERPEAEPMQVYFERGDFRLHLDDKGKLTISQKGAYDLTAAEDGEVKLENAAGSKVHMESGGDMHIHPAGNLLQCGGGPAVARVGDTVQVVVSYGSSAGTHQGTITSGSRRNFSG